MVPIAYNSILSQTDDGIGNGIENAGEDTTTTISTAPKAAAAHRQLDKISDGAQAISDAAGIGAATSTVITELDSIDGGSTGGAADLVAKIGDTEISALAGIGSAAPKSRR